MGTQVPALDQPAAAQLAMGGYHLHFHGVSGAEVAALLRRDGEPAPPRIEDEDAMPGREEAAALPSRGRPRPSVTG